MAFATQAALAIENARLFDESARLLAEQTALNEITLGLMSRLELHDVLETVVRRAGELLVRRMVLFIWSCQMKKKWNARPVWVFFKLTASPA